jgi:hypothetical protein
MRENRPCGSEGVEGKLFPTPIIYSPGHTHKKCFTYSLCSAVNLSNHPANQFRGIAGTD